MNPMVEVGNVSDWKVFAVKDDGTRVPVRHLFVDISVLDGHTKFTETHDLTTATHAELDDGMLELSDGARIVVEAVF